MLAESLSPVSWGEAVLRPVQLLNHGPALLTAMAGGTFPLQSCLGAGHPQQSSPRREECEQGHRSKRLTEMKVYESL